MKQGAHAGNLIKAVAKLVVDVQVAAVVFDPYPVVGVDPVERFAVVGLCPEKNGFHGVYFI